MRDNQLTLLCSPNKPAQKPLHLKSKPVELHRFQSTVFRSTVASPVCEYMPTPTQFYTAICPENMSKTRRAYYDVQSRNSGNGTTGALGSGKLADKMTAETEEIKEEISSYCICKQAKLGEDLMFKCEGYCGNWYHPKCLGMHWTDIDRHTKTSARWYCNECRERAYGLYLACVPQTKRAKK